MANIDLRTIYRTGTDKKSAVDSKIILNKVDTDKEIYSDLKLDLELNHIKERPLNAKEANHDLLKITNVDAIKVSLQNILNTSYGDRLLNPELNFNLKRYLFERMNYDVAYLMGYELCTRLTSYEPRVNIENVEIELDFLNDTYIVNLEITVPTLDTTITLTSILNQDGYYFN